MTKKKKNGKFRDQKSLTIWQNTKYKQSCFFVLASIGTFAYKKYLQYRRYVLSVSESAAVTGELRGRKEGKKEAQIEIAKSLKARGIDINLIIETTGLSSGEIEKL